jgi:hypothetical protein
MAKYKRHVPIKQESYDYPTRFGSHSSMIDEEKTGELNDGQRVVLEDEHGYYTTDRKRLDSGLADPSRCKGDRLTFFKK